MAKSEFFPTRPESPPTIGAYSGSNPPYAGRRRALKDRLEYERGGETVTRCNGLRMPSKPRKALAGGG